MFTLGVVVYAVAAALAVYRLTHRRGDPLAAEPPPAIPGLLPTHIRTDEGETLGAWFVAGDPVRPLVLLLHGNGGSRMSLASTMQLHAGRGDGVLAVSLHAHGDSTGEHYELGLDAREDVRASVAWLRRQYPQRPLLISAFSLGAAAALFAAEMNAQQVDGYLLDAPYSSLARAVRNRTRAAFPWGIEWLAYQGLCLAAPVGLSRPLSDFEPARHLARIPAEVPITLLGSLTDRACMPDELRQMARQRGDVRLVLTAGTGHRALFETDPTSYLHEFDRLVRGAPERHEELPPSMRRPAPKAPICAGNADPALDVATEPRLWRAAADSEEWTSRSGCLVRIDVLAERSGAAHCGHAQARVIITGTPLGSRYTGPHDARTYIRDPEGTYHDAQLTQRFTASTTLPREAVDSGFRRGALELWHTPNDPSALYLKSPSAVERWPLGTEAPCE